MSTENLKIIMLFKLLFLEYKKHLTRITCIYGTIFFFVLHRVRARAGLEE
jgi:hypothetical protein